MEEKTPLFPPFCKDEKRHSFLRAWLPIFNLLYFNNIEFWKKKQHIISEQGSSSRSYRQKTHNKRMLLYQKNFCVNPKFTSKVNSMDINLSLCFLWINNFIIITSWNHIRERRQADFKVIRWFLEILIYYIVVVREKSSKTSFKQTKKARM